MVRYIPILRWKRGERVALRNLSPGGRASVAPLVFIAADQYAAKPATATRPASTAAEALAADVLACWGTHPFFLDASLLPTPHGGQHPLIAIAQACRAAGLQMAPAFTLGAPVPYRAAVPVVAAIDGRGAALRVDLQEFTSASSWAAGTGLAAGDTHLIADFAGNIANVAALGTVLTNSFSTLHLGGSWGSVTVAGCSLPENFTGFAQGQYQITRHEWSLWQQLAANVHNYPVDYGDYATVAPAAPPPGIAWGFPINVKYTLDNEFLVCRGVKTTGPAAVDMDVQLRGHAQAIAGYVSRNSIASCWGDNRIDRVVAGLDGPGNLENWVQISVNRHIEKVRNDLP